MIVTMDAAGRLVIPREIRREAGLEAGVPLEIRWREGVVEIEPAPRPVTLTRKGSLLVAAPAEPGAPLRSAIVERTRAIVRRRDEPRGTRRRR